jgi:mRNA interferase YafQ
MREIKYTTRIQRGCHIRPDLVLIYRKPDDASLELVRLGSHSELTL